MSAETPVPTAAEEAEIHRVQRFVQALLRIGLALAVVLMAVGAVLKVIARDRSADSVALFALGGAASRGDLLMALGVLALAATPAVRVLALVVMWGRERDWRFVGVALCVIVTLAIAIVAGHG